MKEDLILNNLDSKSHHLSLPVSKTQLKELKLGDIVYFTGIIVTGRDHFHKRILEYKNVDRQLPKTFDLVKGSALYHMGPIVKKISSKNYQIISGGPTTSARMNDYQTQVAKQLDLRFIIGKGGMENVAWKSIPALYLQYPGGAGALITKFIKEVIAVEWMDLGTPEAAWFLKVENFGPLAVTIDVHGNSLYSSTQTKN